MELSIREAAALLGVPVRTLRARVARGEIPGRRQGQAWVVDRRDLPLTEAQRQVLQARAGEVRAAVDAILPSRVAQRPDRATRSLADLDAFRGVVDALRAVRAAADLAGGPAAAGLLRAAAGHVGEASFVFEREARARMSWRSTTSRCHPRRSHAAARGHACMPPELGPILSLPEVTLGLRLTCRE